MQVVSASLPILAGIVAANLLSLDLFLHLLLLIPQSVEDALRVLLGYLLLFTWLWLLLGLLAVFINLRGRKEGFTI